MLKKKEKLFKRAYSGQWKKNYNYYYYNLNWNSKGKINPQEKNSKKYNFYTH